jgi:hypothetical protein
MNTGAQINNNLLNGRVTAAAAGVREQIKGRHSHLEQAEISLRIAERDSKSVSELELECSPPGLFNAFARCLLGQADASDASNATLLRRVVALAAEEKAAADPELKTQMRERAKAMKYGTMRRDYLAALRDGCEPGDQIALELLAALLHLHVRLLREDGTQEKEIKCAAPVAQLHLLPVGGTFCTLILPDFEGVRQAAPADNVPKPPPTWAWPVVGERMEVDVVGFSWCPAKVITVLLADGQFKARISSPDDDVWDDWLTWKDEGTEWRRPPLPPAAAIASPVASPVAAPASPESDDTVDPHVGSEWEDHPTQTKLATAADAAINSGGGGDGVTDLSQLRKAVDALTERQLTRQVPAPADAPVESEATELSLKPPEQLTKMVALLAQCSAVKAEGEQEDAATEACLEMCADKESALNARTDKLESKEVQTEEALQQLKGCSESLQLAGLDTNEVRAKLNDTNSSLEQLQRERVECNEAVTFVQSLPEQLQQQVPPAPPHPYPPPHPPPYPFPQPRPRHCPRHCPRHRLCVHLTVSTHPTGRRHTRARCVARGWRICLRSCRAARRCFPPS